MNFWDVEETSKEFDFETAKKNLVDNLNHLHSMSVEEQTLYKKWIELQEDVVVKDKDNLAVLYDTQWRPTDIFNKEQTIKEIEELDPYVDIVNTDKEANKWVKIRKMIHTMDWTANPGRNIKGFIKDRNSEKILGLISLASDVTALSVRDEYIGWTRDNRFKDKKLGHTTIASSIVCTQPFGYNFLGGKLVAMMTTVPEIRDKWKEKYKQTLIAVGTTSLYGIHSQYNGIPLFKTLGESKGKVSIKPDDEYYAPLHKWLKEEHSDWYKKEITDERIRNGESMGISSGPVSGIKQKILGKIFKECGIKGSSYNHGFRRGVYLAMMYENGPEFLRGEIPEEELRMKKKFEDGQEYINTWWKRKAIKRYSKLHDEGRIKPEHLYYVDGIGKSWEEFKKQYLKEVGR